MTPRAAILPKHNAFNFTNFLQSLPALTTTRAPLPCSACLFSTSSASQSIGKKKVRRRIDPYRAAQARQRKAANQARQAVLKNVLLEATGDPVRSKSTPLIESFSTGQPIGGTDDQKLRSPQNFFVSAGELKRSIEYSQTLTTPLPPENPNSSDPNKLRKRLAEHGSDHLNAERALEAIVALENGSSKDRTRVNIQRVIAEFGRHSTDNFLPPKPASSPSVQAVTDSTGIPTAKEAVPKRAGPDTGSSEVQVAILTVKINALADNLEKKDKHNKRNLRLLVHRRQKLLAYLRRSERGGPRWQHLVERLGINDAMWKGEISL